WWVDPEAAVGAELGAAQHISTWMALAQAHRGVVLADRLPKVAALFEAGLISEALVRTTEYRTALVTDPHAIEQVDALLAEQVMAWGPLSMRKTEQAIDAIVDQVDPAALRRSRKTSCHRDVQFGSPSDEAGFTTMWARLYAPDGEVLEGADRDVRRHPGVLLPVRQHRLPRRATRRHPGAHDGDPRGCRGRDRRSGPRGGRWPAGRPRTDR
ncbi:MAG: DUF222 domain-containing protein, partial [Mycobacterium sp.]|nr:DUF222 domain-containing protein [Mycobacterium sp.]